MASRGFLDLRATHNKNRWYLPVCKNVCVGSPGKEFLFGGAGLAAAILAMQRTCGRPVLWATAQYLSYARPPNYLDLDVIVPVQGKFNTQARVVGHVADREILTVNAALGERESEISHQWAVAPKAQSPNSCSSLELNFRQPGDIHDHLEVRLAKGRFGDNCRNGGPNADGHVVLWARTGTYEIDVAMLAIIADFVPSAVGNAIGKAAGGNSLDNTIRIRHLVPTEWVLCDIKIHSVHAGFGYGRMHLFAQDGELMATAGQSFILRMHDDANT